MANINHHVSYRAARGRSGSPRGFTVIELMVVVAIMAVLAGIGGPSMLNMVRTSKVRGAASDLYGDMLMARSEAIKRRTTITLAATSSAWSNGWTVKAGSTTLSTRSALPSDMAVQINVPAASTPTSITYGSNGRVTSTVPTIIFYSADTRVQARCVSVDAAGLPRMRTDTDYTASDGCD